ncbi:zincin-like metallopeptidase domain-containing protein [Ligilactobacillus salivarius]|uniref:zincin-like metallopeptidase domain-containing protein n=2 Tax=Bacilli TaxID=91061 RepID=UPI003655588E
MKTKEQRKAELKAVQDKILKAVENATTSPEKLMELMLFVGKYEKRYSFNNRWLLASQGARVVDSYKGWQNRGYQVQKGSSALQIIVPSTCKYFMTDNGTKSLRYATKQEKQMIADGQIKVIEYTSFALKNCVFDVTQTDMPEDEIPSAYDNKHLTFKGLSEEDAQAIVQTVDKVSQDINVKLLSKFENWDKFNRVGIAKGFYSPKQKIIVTNPNNTDSENVKTLIHELTHAILDPESKNVVSKNLNLNLKKVSYSLGELQAEMTAKLVTSHFGMEDDESVGYIASWTGNGKKLQELKPEDKVKVLDDVLKVSDYLIELIEK